MRLGPNADGRINQLEFALAFANFEMAFVLPGEVHVTDPFLRECRRRAARPGVEDRSVSIELGHEFPGIVFRTATAEHTAPCRQKAELAVT